MARVTISNDERVLAALAKISELAPDKQFNEVAARIVLADAQQRVPIGPGRRGHRPGTLARTGRASGTKKAGFVRYGGGKVPYAGPIHFGHFPRPQGGYTLPNPWLYDAADSRADEVKVRFLEHFAKVVAGLGLGPVRG